MDYDCVKSNFYGRFALNKQIIDEKQYEEMKLKHLKEQGREETGKVEYITNRNRLIWKIFKYFKVREDKKKLFKITQEDMCAIFNMDHGAMSRLLKEEEKKDPEVVENH